MYLLSFIRLQTIKILKKNFIQPYLRLLYKFKTNKVVVYLFNKTIFAKYKLKLTIINREFIKLRKNTILFSYVSRKHLQSFKRKKRSLRIKKTFMHIFYFIQKYLTF